MRKAIIVIDMPEHCIECRFNDVGFCQAIHDGGEYIPDDTLESKPNWCPLIEVPNKKEEKQYSENGVSRKRQYRELIIKRRIKIMQWTNSTIETTEYKHMSTSYRELSATEKADNDCKRIIKEILEHGSLDKNPRPKYSDGTPAHTYSINHVMQTFDISKGELPLLSLRPIAIKKAIGEILWIYQDQTSNLDILRDKYGVTWWDEWSLHHDRLILAEDAYDEDGKPVKLSLKQPLFKKETIDSRSIGCCYGETVRRHRLIDNLLENIKKDPDSRRHIISLWQEDDFRHEHGLKPCALFSQYVVRHEEDGDYLDGFMMLRSSDYLTAGAINQCQYIALLMMIAKHTGYKVGKFTNFIVNCQIYDRHIDNARTMLNRESVPANPKIILNPDKTDFYSFTIDDFKIIDYPREEISKNNPQLSFDLGI